MLIWLSDSSCSVSFILVNVYVCVRPWGKRWPGAELFTFKSEWRHFVFSDGFAWRWRWRWSTGRTFKQSSTKVVLVCLQSLHVLQYISVSPCHICVLCSIGFWKLKAFQYVSVCSHFKNVHWFRYLFQILFFSFFYMFWTCWNILINITSISMLI